MKKGFTLIELISTIIIIGILSLIAFPLTQYLINNSKQKAYSAIISNIEEAASNYSVYNELGYNELFKSIEVSKIQEKGYLTMDDIIDPRNNEVINGCVLYRWKSADKKYEFKYSENCNPKDFYPNITINVLNDNNKEWMNEKLKFDINGEYREFKYCVSKGNNECIKNIDYITDTTIEEYGRDIYVCATGFFGEEVGNSTCTKAYNIDYTDPEITYNNSVTTTDKIIVNATCSDATSGANKIEYSINDGEYGSSNIFTKLTTGTYNIKVKCTDNASRYSVKEDNVTLPEPINPDIAKIDEYRLPGYEFAQNKTIRITYNSTNIEKPQYYFHTEPFDSVENYATTSVKVVNCGKATMPVCNSTNYTTQTLEANTWYKVEPNVDIVDIKFTYNAWIKAFTTDETGNTSSREGYANYTVTYIDSTKPNVSIASQNIMTDRTTITATCSDTDTTPNSGITLYEFSKDGGNSWETKSVNINSHTFEGLTQGTNYNYAVRCTNGSGMTNTSTVTDKTKVIANPTIAQIDQYIRNYTWAQSRTIKITFNTIDVQNPVNQYKEGNGKWITVSGNELTKTYTANVELYARTLDVSGNESTGYKYKVRGTGYLNVTNIDSTKPNIVLGTVSSTSNSLTIPFTASDSESGIERTTCEYGTSTSYGSTGEISGNSCVLTEIKSGTTYYYKLTTTNGSGITNEALGSKASSSITNPTIAQIDQHIRNYTWAQSRTIKITFNTTNVQNPVNQYKEGNGKWITVSGNELTKTYTANVELYARTLDASGNESEGYKVKGAGYLNVINIDSTKPDKPTIALNLGSYGGTSYTSGNWTNQYVYHTVTSSDSLSGIAYYEIYPQSFGWSKLNDYVDAWGTTYSSSNTQVRYHWNFENVNWNFKIRAVDNAGNISDESNLYNVKIDREKPDKPTITLKLGSSTGNSYTNGAWTNQDVWHIINSTDKEGSGVNRYQYSHDNSNWVNDIHSLGWNSSYNNTRTELVYRINWSGQWNFFIRAVDNVGNISDSSSMFTVRIDKNTPHISINGLPSTITVGDSYIYSDYVKRDYDTPNAISGESSFECMINNISANNTNTLTKGDHTLSCVTTSHAGNSASVTHNIKVNEKSRWGCVVNLLNLSGYEGYHCSSCIGWESNGQVKHDYGGMTKKECVGKGDTLGGQCYYEMNESEWNNSGRPHCEWTTGG